MGQPGFFDLSRRYEGLDEKKDPLVTLAAVVPWEMFRSLGYRTVEHVPTDRATHIVLAK